ncbi:MAG: mannosyl transferase [Verrucomicrobiales bacterium]|nr:mannosyl transferase [Verrucomicrobiales bacterium]
MPRYARMLSEAFSRKGYEVEMWAPKERLHRFGRSPFIKKWLGYVDQFLIFPLEVKIRLRSLAEGTLFSFTDQALGPWVPLVASRRHVIHCHDFLAQRSAAGEIPENPVSSTGRQYQAYIRRGYRKGRNFISVSKKTREELHHFFGGVPSRSEVVYNGLNQDFTPLPAPEARAVTGRALGLNLGQGFILHVGGNQWYKNRTGVVEIYDAWRSGGGNLPLVMIGAPPPPELEAARGASAFREDIHFCQGVDDTTLRAAYAGASVFLFPSLAEGFGWPIAEAMASGCPVIITNEPPMTEVGGDACFLIPRRPSAGTGDQEVTDWAREASAVLSQAVDISAEDRTRLALRMRENVKRFDPGKAIDRMESIYLEIFNRPAHAPL